MAKVVCDCCGQEMTIWHHVVTTPKTEGPCMNIAALIRYGNGRDICEECYNKFLDVISLPGTGNYYEVVRDQTQKILEGGTDNG